MSNTPAHSSWFTFSRRGYDDNPTPEQVLNRIAYGHRLLGAVLLEQQPMNGIERRVRVGWQRRSEPGTDRGPIPT